MRQETNVKQSTLRLAQTGMMIAMLVTFQYLTGLFGNQFVTGSVVNLVLILTVMLFGLYSGVAVAAISPWFAFILPIAIGPGRWELIPLISLGNVAMVVIWHFICKIKVNPEIIPQVIALVAGAVAKYLIIYLGQVYFIIPHIILPSLDAPAGVIPPPIQTMMHAMSYPQLITATIGGVIAIGLIPILKMALKKSH